MSAKKPKPLQEASGLLTKLNEEKRDLLTWLGQLKFNQLGLPNFELKLWTVFSRDTECRCEFSSTANKLPRSKFSCKACSLFSRYAALPAWVGREGETGSRLATIELPIASATNPGELELTSLLVESVQREELEMDYSTRQFQLLSLLSTYPELENCYKIRGNTEDYLELDPFQAHLLSALLLPELAKAEGIPYRNLITAFMCGSYSYLIKEEASSLMDLTESIKDQLQEQEYYSKEDLRSILFQVILQLHFLWRQGVSLSEPNLRLIYTKPEAATYLLKDEGESNKKEGKEEKKKKLTFDPALVLDPDLYSTLRYQNVGLTNMNAKIREILDSAALINLTKIQTHLLALPGCKGNCPTNTVLSYILTAENWDLFWALRTSGLPIFGPSWETVAIFYSLMTYKPFYLAIIKSPDLYSLWNACWIDKDLEVVNKKLLRYHAANKPATFEQSRRDLLNIRIRCDVLELLYNKVVES